jgi:hypothetical protein
MIQVTCDVCANNKLENIEIDSDQWEKLECATCSYYKIQNKVTGEVFFDVNFTDEQISKLGREYEEYSLQLIENQKDLEVLLDKIGKTDDRPTRGIKINEIISDDEIPDKLKEIFDISDDDLISQEDIERFFHEVNRAIIERKISQCKTTIESLEKKQSKSIGILHRIQNTPIETKPTKDSIQVEIMAKQFKLFSELELKLRKCVKKALNSEKSWWIKLVPDSIRRDIVFYNQHDPDIKRLIDAQDFELLDKMTFKHLQMIITGQPLGTPNWSYFENIFPDYFFVNTRLRECNGLRNKGPYHTNTLDEKQEKTLKNNADELIGYIDEYLK